MLVKAQIISLSVLIFDSFPNFSLHHAASGLPPSTQLLRGRDEVGGKEVHVRYGIAMDKTWRVERWFDISIGRWGLQAAEQLFIIICASFSCIVMEALSAPWSVSCISMWMSALRHTLLHLISALSQDGICCDFWPDGSSEGGLWFPEQSSVKGPKATGTQCVTQGCCYQVS